MSVIAWDGHQLASDKRAYCGNIIRTVTKVFRFNDTLLGYAGNTDAGEELLAWFCGGRSAPFPTWIRDKEAQIEFLVVWPDGNLWTYERSQYPVRFPPQKFAIGSGRDFAMAAMHCGKTAAEAVEIACLFDTYCGNGVDVMTHNKISDLVGFKRVGNVDQDVGIKDAERYRKLKLLCNARLTSTRFAPDAQTYLSTMLLMSDDFGGLDNMLDNLYK